MLKEEVLSKIKLTGQFKLRSGLTSDTYYDKYLFESDPLLLKEIVDHLYWLVPDGTEILAGLELGGIPISTALSLKLNLPQVFVRKAQKSYGLCKLVEGCAMQGKNTLIVEDVITTGGQVIASANELRKLGATVNGVACVILRDESARLKLQQHNLVVKELFTTD